MLARESIQIFSLNPKASEIEEFKRIKAKLAKDVTTCEHCCLVYNNAKEAYFKHYSSCYRSEDLDRFKGLLLSWDIERTSTFLSDFCQRTTIQYKDVEECKCVFYDVLNSVELLMHNGINRLFCRVLKLTKQYKAKTLYPGMLLLTIHEDTEVQKIASGQLNGRIKLSKLYLRVFSMITQHMQYLNLPFTKNIDTLISCFMNILYLCDTASIIPLLDSFQPEQFLSHLLPMNYSFDSLKLLLEFFWFLLNKYPCPWFSSDQCTANDRENMLNHIIKKMNKDLLSQEYYSWLSDFILKSPKSVGTAWAVAGLEKLFDLLQKNECIQLYKEQLKILLRKGLEEPLKSTVVWILISYQAEVPVEHVIVYVDKLRCFVEEGQLDILHPQFPNAMFRLRVNAVDAIQILKRLKTIIFYPQNCIDFFAPFITKYLPNLSKDPCLLYYYLAPNKVIYETVDKMIQPQELNSPNAVETVISILQKMKETPTRELGFALVRVFTPKRLLDILTNRAIRPFQFFLNLSLALFPMIKVCHLWEDDVTFLSKALELMKTLFPFKGQMSKGHFETDWTSSFFSQMADCLNHSHLQPVVIKELVHYIPLNLEEDVLVKLRDAPVHAREYHPVADWARKELLKSKVVPLENPQKRPSKVQQFRNESIMASRAEPIKPATTISFLPAESCSDEEDEPREKRKIIKLDLPNVSNPQMVRLQKPTNVDSAPVANIKDLFRSILSWGLDDRGNTPPDFQYNLAQVPSTFKNSREYAQVMIPFITLETWEQFQQNKTELGSSITIYLTTINLVDDFHEMIFTAQALDIKSSDWSDQTLLLLTKGRDEFLVMIDSMQKHNEEMRLYTRAYIGKKSYLAPILRPSSFHARSIISLTTTLREYEAMTLLPSLNLNKYILNPKPISWSGSALRISQYQQALGVNEPQAKAIEAATTLKSGFCLIQGPPGTGKTRTIIAMIGAMLKKSNAIELPVGAAKKQSQSKGILVCAPSNAAIDEIARRLKVGILDLKGKKFQPKLVRVGTTAIHPSVQDITLDALLEEELSHNPKFLSAEKNRQGRNEILNQIKDLRKKEQTEENQDKIIELKGLLDDEFKKTNPGDLDKIKRETRNRIITQADVILCTLSGSAHDTISNLNISFPTVIIDEACQSVEVSTLIPLRYNTEKCILVGDPKQLPPTVLSQTSVGHNYEQSLFQRLMVNNYPVNLLSIQYRMHPDIVSFPSIYFYQSRLTNAPSVPTSSPWEAQFPCWMFYDVQGKEYSYKTSYQNKDEAKLCVGIVSKLCNYFPNESFLNRIGIITFYKSQVRLLKDMFVESFGKNVLHSIDINTVDGFQGQEKDIIILSCVRTSRVGFISDVRRINVALTRGKLTLLILGDAKTLKSDPCWRAMIDHAQVVKRILPLKALEPVKQPKNLLPKKN